jgi:DNA-binding CsgD family transcriptional regulator
MRPEASRAQGRGWAATAHPGLRPLGLGFRLMTMATRYHATGMFIMSQHLSIVESMSPGEHAAAALAAHPEMSNRAIAAELGVSKDTVRNLRGSTAQNYAVERTVGLDGKSYPARY